MLTSPSTLALAVMFLSAPGGRAQIRVDVDLVVLPATVEDRHGLRVSRRDKKVLLVISDGADNASAHSLAKVLQMAEESSAIIYTVDLFAPDDQDAKPKVLLRLAQATGGEAFFPKKLDDVVTICDRIARDIRSQYTIGYV